MTTYTDTPQPQNQRNVSQVNLLNNNRYLLDVSSPGSPTGILPVDHYASGDNTANPTDGFHKQVSLLNLAATPANLTNAINSQDSDGIFYSLADNNSNAQLNYKANFNSVLSNYQITPCLPLIAAGYVSVVANTGVPTLQPGSFNVTSVTFAGNPLSADYKINFTQNPPSVNYIALVTCSGNVYIQVQPRNIGYYEFISASGNVKLNGFSFMIFGG
jgi:hypothetical protein